MYKRLQQKGVLQFQFVFPNNKTFLRMHKPKKFGDDLTDIRYSYQFVNKTKKPISGFENGKSYHGFRYVYPFFDKDKNHLGAVEISFSSNKIQNNLTNLSKIHSHFIVDKTIFKDQIWLKEDGKANYIKSIEDQNYLFVPHYNNDNNGEKFKTEIEKLIKPLKKQINLNIKLKREFALYQIDDNKIKVISFLPINNIENNEVKAYIVSYVDSDYIKEQIINYRVMNTIIFFTLFILIVFLYKSLTKKEYLENIIKIKTKELRKTNKKLKEAVYKEVLINQKKEELILKQSKLVSLGEMMDAIAHQWKQPLGVINAHSQSLQLNSELNLPITKEDIAKSTSSIENQVSHLNETIDNFRGFFRTDRKFKYENIKYVVDLTLNLMQNVLLSNKITVTNNIDEELEVLCIKEEFKHIFINLINNSKNAFIANNIEKREISFNTITDNKFITLNIRDNAGGIPKDILQNIFKSNFTTKMESEGTGVGLYLTTQIVEKFNATIRAKNTQNGVTFSIRFPINKEV